MTAARAAERPYRGAYGPQRLWPWADRLNEQLARGQDVYCYFNNDYDGHAVTDALWLRDAIETRTELKERV